MTTAELQSIVMTEGICLLLIILIMVSSFKRWKYILYATSVAATLAFFSAWHFIMATASIMIYGPASVLLWIELDKAPNIKHERRKTVIRRTCWGFLAAGVALLILKNILNIYGYLA